MTQPDPIVLDVDPSGYVAGLGRGEAATQSFTTTLRGIPVAVAPVQRALDTMTPKRATIAGFTTLAAVAAGTQQQLATMQARARVAGQDFDRLGRGMRDLAKEFPVGNRGAQEMVKSLQGIGVANQALDKRLQATSKSVGNQGKVWGAAATTMDRYRVTAEKFLGTSGGGGINERRVEGLSKAFIRLGAATGESASAVGVQMVQLNRAMGTGLDVRRVERLSDSLTTVSAVTGASASGILQFSRAIAPFARSAGIGQTAVMGMSAAFSQMGEDGFGASTAVSKIMGDLSRSVREGTPNMAAYAQMVGKTREEFAALFKQNPAEALIQITEALGADPANAPRMLEQVGLDGVRAARSLQAISQQGLLRSTVYASQGGYGSGSTRAGAEEAMDGLADSGQRAAAAAEQLAEAMGRPFLASLTLATDALGGFTSFVGGIAGSGPVQATMSTLVPLGLAALTAYKLARPLTTAALATQAATSTPVRAGVAGFQLGRYGGDAAAARQGFLGRWGGPVLDRSAAGIPLSVNPRIDALSQRVLAGPMQAMGAFMGPGGTGGPGMLRMGGAAASMAMGSYLRMTAEQLRLGTTPSSQRTAVRMSGFGDQSDRFNQRMQDLATQRGAGTLTTSQYMRQSTDALRTFHRDVAAAGGSVRSFRTQLAMGGLAVAGQGGRFVGSMAGRGLGAVGGALGGPVGVGLMAGMVGYGGYRKMLGRREEDELSREGASTYIDEYRTAMGKASDAAETFASRMATASESMAAGVSSWSDALAITKEDLAAAAGVRGKAIRTFPGTAVAAGRTLAQENQTFGIAPDEMARIALDLVNQYGEDGAREALSQVGGQRPTDALAQRTDVRQQVSDLVNAPDRGGWASVRRRFDPNRLPGMTGPNGDAGAEGPLGMNWYADTLSDRTKEGTSAFANSLQAREQQRGQLYGREFGAQEARREMDQAIATAMERGDNAQVQTLVKEFAQNNNVDAGNQVAFEDIRKAGGFSNFMASQFESWASTYGKGDRAEQLPRPQASWVSKQLGDNPLARFFDTRGGSAASTAVAASIARPEDSQLRAAAMNAMIRDAEQAGTSMQNLATQAADAASQHGNVADASYQLLSAFRDLAMQGINVASSFQTAATTAEQRMSVFIGDARRVGADQGTTEKREQGRQGLQEAQGQAVATAQARLQRQREYQITVGRQEQDFRRQRGYAEDDYERQRGRAQLDFGIGRGRMLRQFNLQRTRSNEDFQLQTARAEQDWQIQRVRQERDFGISMVQATEDYNRQRMRTIRDFGIQMARQVEDQAKSMFDPYQRLQVQPVWDAGSLGQNLDEQTRQLERQIADLDRLRSSGLSQGAIDLLGLTDPKNGQQVAQTLADIMRDPAVTAQLNQLAEGRLTATAALVGDPSNTATRRAQEDLQRGLADMAVDFTTNMGRSTEAYRHSVDDATADFARMMERQHADYSRQLGRAATDLQVTLGDMGADHRRAMDRAAEDQGIAMERMGSQQALAMGRLAEDLKRIDEELVTDLGELTAALNMAVHGQFIDFEKLTQNGMEGWVRVLRRFLEGDVQSLIQGIGGIGTQLTGAALAGARGQIPAGDGGGYGYTPSDDVPDLKGQPPQVDWMMHQVRSGLGRNVALHSGLRPGAITAAGNPSYHGAGRAVDLPPDGEVFQWIKGHYPNSREIIWSPAGKSQVHNGRNHMYSGVTRDNHWDHVHWALAQGGAVIGRGTGTSDSVNAHLSNGEHVWNAREVEMAGGHGAVAALRALVLDRSSFRDMGTAQSATHITYHADSYVYDHSVNIAKVELAAESPREMLDAFAQMERQANLTRPQQQRTSR